MSAWGRVLACAALVLAAPLLAGTAASGAGEAIYRDGRLPSGAVLVGRQAGAASPTSGAEAACANCHQRSGLGATEGRTQIPPVAGVYLFHPGDGHADAVALPYVQGIRENRHAYTEATLARAIREGIDSDGRPLAAPMPHFDISDADMAALIGYLQSLDAGAEPGVTDAVLHFATVFTPDVDPVRRKAVLDVLQAYFADKNRFQYGPSARLQGSVHTMYANSMFRVNRRWELHVWDLAGAPATWKAQLEKRAAAEPVFAVVSGLGGADWRPVHDFCEEQALPCLFPNVDAPSEADGDFYTVYFSKGVQLEAEVIAGKIAQRAGTLPVVHQVYRAGDIGEPAARALSDALRARGVETQQHAIASRAPAGDVARAVHAGKGADVLVLWLRPSDLAALGDASSAASQVFASGLMGGLERAPLPPSWRRIVLMSYPFELPDRRVARVDFARGWFNLRRIPVVDERLQVDTYLACGLLAETISHLSDTFVRPYLVEQLQAGIGHRIVTGYYPHLTLATGQHFASKGAYLVRLRDGERLEAESDWLVP